MKHVLGFSGGIDSQAVARWLLNRYPAEDVILLNSDAGGNEHPMTTEFVQNYSRDVHPVVMISPIIADMDGRAKGKIAQLGLKPNDPLTFDGLAELKGRFPFMKGRFCTSHLKLYPQHRWMRENLTNKGEKFIRYSGVRRDESNNRSNRQPVEIDDFFHCELRHPCVDWTKQMCFDFVQAHGEEVNPLYKLGFTRVGCAPCINSRKGDVLNWVQRFPEMIEKVRGWEERIGKTFFPPCVPGLEINWIDDVVRWAKTRHGGKQFDLLVLDETPACESAYGLCE